MRTIVIGDVHGCIEELDELLAEVYHPGDRLVFLGDLVDRGPDSLGVVRRVRELGAECVMGNHESKHLRYRKHEAMRKACGKKNPMKPFYGDKLKLQESLTVDDWAFLFTLPKYIRLGKKLMAVHAGCKPGIAVEAQDENVLTHVRYLRKDNLETVNLNDEEIWSSGKAAFWTELWTGPDSIIYGHHPADKNKPAIDECEDDVRCVCIDTGCCFGGHLTAAIVEGSQMEFVKVKAKHLYAKR